MVERVLPCGIPCVIVFIVDCACCVCVDCCLFLKYDLKKLVHGGVWCEVEVVFEFSKELLVGDGVVGFGEVYVDCESWLLCFDVLV